MYIVYLQLIVGQQNYAGRTFFLSVKILKVFFCNFNLYSSQIFPHFSLTGYLDDYWDYV